MIASKLFEFSIQRLLKQKLFPGICFSPGSSCQLPHDLLFLLAEIAGRLVKVTWLSRYPLILVFNVSFGMNCRQGTALYVLKLKTAETPMEPQRLHSRNYLKVFLPLSLTLGFLLGFYFLFSLSLSRTKAQGGKVSITFVGQSRRDRKSISSVLQSGAYVLDYSCRVSWQIMAFWTSPGWFRPKKTG